MKKFLIIFMCVFGLIVLLTGLALAGVISNPFKRATPAPVVVTPAQVVPVVSAGATAAPVVAGVTPVVSRDSGNEGKIAGKASNVVRRFFF
jgi:hypothetical protein